MPPYQSLTSLLASVGGYVRCFSIAQNPASTSGPVSWLCLEVGLSIMRLVVWAWNPTTDDAPSLDQFRDIYRIIYGNIVISKMNVNRGVAVLTSKLFLHPPSPTQMASSSPSINRRTPFDDHTAEYVMLSFPYIRCLPENYRDLSALAEGKSFPLTSCLL